VDPLLGSALNEQELWREMVRWAGGRVVEERGLLLVDGPSPYLRVAIRTDPRLDAAAVVARATGFFAADPAGFLVLARRPDDADIERAALAAGFRAGWTERSMALASPPTPGVAPAEIEVRLVEDASRARRRGLGDALTRMAARTGFEMGAGAARLGASEMGAGLYRRIGFEDLGAAIVELESPSA